MILSYFNCHTESNDLGWVDGSIDLHIDCEDHRNVIYIEGLENNDGIGLANSVLSDLFLTDCKTIGWRIEHSCEGYWQEFLILKAGKECLRIKCDSIEVKQIDDY